MKRNASGGRWQQLSLLAGVVLAAHLALLQGSWPILTPRHDRWVQHFTTRTIAAAPAPEPPTPTVTPAAPPAPPSAGVPGGTTSLRTPAPPAAPRRLAVSEANPSTPPPPPSPPPEAPAPAPEPSPAPQAATAPSAAASFVPQVLAVPQPAVMRYDVSVHARGFTLSGQARLDWWHDGERYDVRLEVSAPGLRQRVQQSTGRITEEGLAPDRFSDKSRSEQATHFDRAGGRVVFSNNRPEAALAAGMQDRLSVVVQLSMLVASDPARFPPGTQVVIPTASTREAEDWTFRVEGEEDLDLPGGRVRALKLLRLPRREFDQKVELWLAPGKDYAPVRLRLTNPDGGWVDQRWSSTDRG